MSLPPRRQRDRECNRLHSQVAHLTCRIWN
jgi:hypothetical protein